MDIDSPAQPPTPIFAVASKRKTVTIAGSFAQTLLAKIFLLFANLATGVIVARALAPVGRGEQAAMAMWPGLLSGLFSMGLAVALTYNLRRNVERQAELLTVGIVLAAISGTIATTVGIIFVPHWLTRYDWPVINFARWMMLLVPFTTTTYVMQAALEARGDFTISNLSKSTPQLASVLILASLLITHHLTPFSSTAGYVAPWFVVPFVLAWHLRAALATQIRHFRELAKQVLGYGLRAYPIDILATLSGQVDQVLVVGLLSPSSLGLYTVGLSVSRVLSVFHASLVTVLFPRVASLDRHEVIELTGRAARISTLFASVASLLLIATLPFLMVHVYGGNFRSVVPVAQILCIEVVVSGAAAIFCQSFMATGKPGVIALFQVAGLGLTVPFMLLLIPRFGLSGAALALLFSSTCRLGFVLASYPLMLRTRIPRLLFTANDLTFVYSRIRGLSAFRRRA